MFITRIKLRNWRNFKTVDVPLRPVSYLVGANGVGKSNFLDALRFLRDVSKPEYGGGLQKAVEDHGGLSKIRCLHARNDSIVGLEVHLSSDIDAKEPEWRYKLEFRHEGVGKQRLIIHTEEFYQGNNIILKRPDKEDEEDIERRTQAHIGQTQSNKSFRIVADFFQKINYLHLVPQLLRYESFSSGRLLDGDPFGQRFLSKIAEENKKTRDARLNRIQDAIKNVIPTIRDLQFDKDTHGRPHLKAKIAHFRPQGAWHSEHDFSDGTLRLIGLLWSVMENNSVLLLEEPELSLNDAIVRQIPEMLYALRNKRQVLVSTHSYALLSNSGIGSKAILYLHVDEKRNEDTIIRLPNEEEEEDMRAGLSPAEVILPKTKLLTADNLVGSLL